MKVSRSRLFALTLQDFLQRQQHRQLLEKINQAYQGVPEPTEQKRLRGERRLHRQVVEGEW